MGKANLDPFSEIYGAYAAGCLDPAFALMVETQAALRPDVSHMIARAETISGIMLEREQVAELSDSAIETALDMIDAYEASRAVEASSALTASDTLSEVLDLPEPLRETALEACATHDWRKLANGVRRLKLNMDSAAEVELYRIAPGASVPRHSHKGAEFTLVVAGGFSDETGSHGPGDLTIKGPADTHRPVGDKDGPCFALAVHDGGLRFTGMLGLVQRLLGQSA